MGAGKTAISRAIAEELNKTYVSTDGLIEKREGESISAIFEKKGEGYFREVEKSVIKEVCEQDDQVVDTGGGAVLDPENLDTFRKNGIVICLWADPETILARTKKHTHRPLLRTDDPKQRIQKLLEHRRPFYEKADFHVDTTMGNVTVIVERIVRHVTPLAGAYPEKAEERPGLRLWELLLAKLFQKAATPIMVTDSNGGVVFANTRFKRYFKVTGTNVSGRKWVDIVIPRSMRKAVATRFEKILKTSVACQFQVPVPDKNKGEKYFCWTASPLKEDHGLFVMFVGHPATGGRKKLVDIHPATNGEILDVILASSGEYAPDTARHSLRVMSYAASLAERLNMPPESIETLKIASLLHDIGKVAVDGRILLKKGKLEKHEFEEIKKHPGWSVAMIKPVSFLAPILPIVMSHHENYDGSGYPRGIKGKDIPLGARILSIADVYEALTTDRPYRKACTREEAVEILEDAKAWKLDPELTDIFLEMVRNGHLHEEPC